MSERKQGVVSDFLNCSDEYLGLINDDLGLGLTTDLLRRIQFHYKLKRYEPTTDDLYFLASYMKRCKTLKENVLISGLSSDVKGLTEFFSEFLRDKKEDALIQKNRIKLIEAARSACRDNFHERNDDFSITYAENPEFSFLSGNSNSVYANGYKVSYCRKHNDVRLPSSNSGILILPPDGCDKEYFVQKANILVKELKNMCRPMWVFPCTENGLLNDIQKNVGPSVIYTACLPGHKAEPESVNDTFNPGFIMMVPKPFVRTAVEYSKKSGFTVTNPIYRMTDSKYYSIISGVRQMNVFPDDLEALSCFTDFSPCVGEAVLSGKGSLQVAAQSDDDVSAIELNGNVYEELEKIIDRKGIYCIAGTLNPESPETVSAILALYAFVKNKKPNIAKSEFFIGNETKITVFAFGKNGSNITLDKPRPDGRCDQLFNPASPEETNTNEDDSMKVFNNLSEICGNTPLLRIFPDSPCEIYAKLEMFNPAGSAKDRVALQIIRDAEAASELKQGGTIIEATSGNTGIGLACYGVAKGYKVVIVMPDTMSKERIDLIRAYGAEIVLTDGKLGMQGSTAEAERIKAETPGSIIAGQFDNPSNPKAHTLTTGPEIFRDTDGRVDIFVAGIGTGGTLCGTAEYLKRMKPSVKAIGCEPASSPLITKGTAGPHKIQGIGANFIPKNFKNEIVDGMFTVGDEEAIEMTKEIAKTTGLLVGISSGCAAYAAKKLGEMPENKGKVIVTVFPDTGEHYLSMGIFN